MQHPLKWVFKHKKLYAFEQFQNPERPEGTNPFKTQKQKLFVNVLVRTITHQKQMRRFITMLRVTSTESTDPKMKYLA